MVFLSVLLISSNLCAFFDCSWKELDREFTRLCTEFEAFSQRMGNVFSATASVAPEAVETAGVNIALDVSDRNDALEVSVFVGDKCTEDQITAEIKQGVLLVSFLHDTIQGRLEISSRRAALAVSQYKKMAKRAQENVIEELAESRSNISQVIALPGDVDLSQEPVILLQKGVLKVVLKKYAPKKIRIQRSIEIETSELPTVSATTKVMQRDEFEDALK